MPPYMVFPKAVLYFSSYLLSVNHTFMQKIFNCPRFTYRTTQASLNRTLHVQQIFSWMNANRNF